VTDIRDDLQAALGATYRFERELSGGGMSRVFVAEELELRRRVVIKVLPPDLAAGLSAERFRREIQLAASLQHPHIVPLFAAGEAAGLLYYTMPFVKGESLRERLAREGELPVADTVRILREVVDALACAHAEGIVHRDVKPANVLLSGGHAVVTDFGVAKALGDAAERSTVTSAGVALGTPVYMAPEQAVADPHTDHRADIYAVGIVAYEMLTGTPPFAGLSPQQTLAAQVTEAPEPLLKRRPAVPAGLATAVMRCLEKRPADRWQSAAELLHALDPLGTPSGGTAPHPAVSRAGSADPTVRAVPPSPTPREASSSAETPPSRRPRRWRLLGGGAALAILLGVVYAAVGRRAVPAAPAAASPKSIAVLPFENLGSPDDGYFADGLTEEITSRLASVKELRVTSRTTAMQYKGTKKGVRDIGRELNAAYVLEGSVRWEKSAGTSQIRVTPQLIRVSDDSHLWADRYDAVLAQVFDVQSSIAEKVVSALDVALADSQRQALRARPTENPQAYDVYLRAKDYYQRGVSPQDYRTATDLLRRATALDSNFALAWALAGLVRTGIYWQFYDRSDSNLALARAAIERARRLSPDRPEVHVAAGFYHYWGERNYDAALQEFAAARRGSADGELLEAIGLIQRRQGKWSEALATLRDAATREPAVPVYALDYAETACLMRNFELCGRVADSLVGLAPDAEGGYVYRATAAAGHGDSLGVRAAVDQAARALGRDRIVAALAYTVLPYGTDADRRVLTELPLDAFGTDSVPYFGLKADAWRLLGNAARARVYDDSARVAAEARLRVHPDDDRFHSALGIAYAHLGRHADAVREALRGVELLPLTKDAYFGGDRLVDLATVYTIVGDRTAAIDALSRALAVPGNANAGDLRLNPLWAPLRADPRFARLAAAARP
jgi:serine/threonine-protein kinase